MLGADSMLASVGVCEKQSGNFNTGAINGRFSVAYTAYGLDSDSRVGVLTFDGGGKMSASLQLADSTEGYVEVPVNGTYSVDSNGHGTGTLKQTSGDVTINLMLSFYAVNASELHFVVADASSTDIIAYAVASRQS